MLMLTDVTVLHKIKEGDIRTFEQVFRLYYSPLCLYAAGITGRMAVAEEVVQEVFYCLWRDRQTIQIFHSIKSYLYVAVRNGSLQYVEHCEVRERHQDAIAAKEQEQALSTPEEVLEYKELESVICRAMTKLPERRQRIFRMHRDEGRKYNEIATLLSISIKTVEAEMSKALQTLRKEIEKYIYIL